MCVETKVCSVCGKEKPITEFEKGHRKRSNAYSYRCKECANEYKREAYKGKQTKIKLKHRLDKLKRFCSDHNIEINIEVLNDESKWR